jgi:hypothetical protein
MWDRATRKTPITGFSIPPHAGAAVLAAQAKFEAVADQYETVKGEIDDLKVEREREIAAAKERIVKQAMASGQIETLSVNKVTQKFDSEIEAKGIALEALAQAVDQLGNAFAHEIAADREAHAAAQAADEAEARERVTAALAELRAALPALGLAQNAVAWLADFDEFAAVAGEQKQFGGNALYLDTTGIRKETRSRHEVVLAVLDQLAA